MPADLGPLNPDGALAPEQLLAAAVIRQALDDLRTVKRPACRRFLLVDLWEHDSLWGSLVAGNFERRRLVSEVQRRCQNADQGRVRRVVVVRSVADGEEAPAASQPAAGAPAMPEVRGDTAG